MCNVVSYVCVFALCHLFLGFCLIHTVVVCVLPILAGIGAPTVGMRHLADPQDDSKKLTPLLLSSAHFLLRVPADAPVCVQPGSYT